MAFNDDSFIREVNEELRSDQMKGVWRRFGRYIIVVAILIVAGTAGKVLYDYWDDNRSSGTGDQFLAAMKLADENKNDEALAALDKLEKEGHGAYPVLARMRAATVQCRRAIPPRRSPPSTKSARTMPFRPPCVMPPRCVPAGC